MKLRRRGPFDELVERQLSLFAEDDAELLQEAEEAEAAWNAAGRETAEEAYGDYQLVVDAIADRLLDLREAYAATLDPDDLRYVSGRLRRQAPRGGSVATPRSSPTSRTKPGRRRARSRGVA